MRFGFVLSLVILTIALPTSNVTEVVVAIAPKIINIEDKCAICLDDLAIESNSTTGLEYCKRECGNWIHSKCMKDWKDKCQSGKSPIKAHCVYCRKDWEVEDDMKCETKWWSFFASCTAGDIFPLWSMFQEQASSREDNLGAGAVVHQAPEWNQWNDREMLRRPSFV